MGGYIVLTFIDLIFALPLWVRIVIIVLFAVWIIEMFFVPFYVHSICTKIEKCKNLIMQLIETTGLNKNVIDRNEKVLSLLLGINENNQKKKRE